MYLSDIDLKNIWEQLRIECDNPNCQRDCKTESIQPCSIDMCLSNVFWEPLRRTTVDLRKSALLDLSPRRYWNKIVLRENESITLKPGRLLLGRISAKISIPPEYAGKIEGRSSFSRMGLSIHCTGDFINPGYKGHMPLELINFGPNSIKLFPYLPICQLVLIKLSQKPEKIYGVDELQSKYMDDDGGPSYWWRDKRIRSLQSFFSKRNIHLYVQETLLNKLGAQEPETIERFEKFVEKRPTANIENAETLLKEFSRSEDRLKLLDKLKNYFSVTLFTILFGCSIKIVVEKTSQFQSAHYSLFFFTCISFILLIFSFKKTPTPYLGKQELLGVGDKK